MAEFLACRLGRVTNREIGSHVGGITAGAVSHACRRVWEKIAADLAFARRVRDVRAQIERLPEVEPGQCTPEEQGFKTLPQDSG